MSEIKSAIDGYAGLADRLKKLTAEYENLSTRRIPPIENQIADIKDRIATRANIIIDIPLKLAVTNDAAYDLMTHGGIMGDDFSNFARQQHNTNVDQLISKFFDNDAATKGKILLFNLHYVARHRKARFNNVLFEAFVEATPTDKNCSYSLINFDNPEKQEFDSILIFKKWCASGGRECAYEGWSDNYYDRKAIIEKCI